MKVLANRLQSTKLLNANIFGGQGEVLNGDLLFGRDDTAPADKVRLTITGTKGLRNDADTEFRTARLLSEVSGWASQNPQKALHAVTVVDQADLYLPATRKPVTKEPMLDLLRRGRSAGLGVLLGTQNPGDFDYKARGNINTWFVGRISQSNDVDKMRALLPEARTDISSKLANAEMGEFYLLREGEVTALKADRSVMDTRELSEEDILRLARRYVRYWSGDQQQKWFAGQVPGTVRSLLDDSTWRGSIIRGEPHRCLGPGRPCVRSADPVQDLATTTCGYPAKYWHQASSARMEVSAGS